MTTAKNLATIACTLTAPLFPLGRIQATQCALKAAPYKRLLEVVARHAQGDWGCIDPAGIEVSDYAIRACLPILSAHPIDPALPCIAFGENCLLVVTDGDSSTTTVMVPDEF